MTFKWASTALAFFSLLPLPTSCQQILQFGSGEVPSCAQSCQTLLGAQNTCVPSGGAPVTNAATYKSCFCQSSILAELKTGTAPTVCATECPDTTTRNQIATWYNSYCASNQLPEAAGSGGATSAGANPAQSGSPAVASASTSPIGDTVVSNEQPSWWDEHAKWIAMAIVLIVAFALIAVLGVWLKKRHYRKRERARSLGQPSNWGPTRGAGYPSSEKGWGNEGSVSASPDLNRDSSGKGKRLSKLVGR